MDLLLLSILSILLLICSVYDIRQRIVPNAAVAAILVFGLVNSLMHHSLAEGLTGLIVPAFPLWVAKTRFGYVIGSGDIKLLAAIGVWLNWQMNLYVFLVALIFAWIWILVKRERGGQKMASVPFAPFISAAAWLWLLIV